MSRRTWAVDGTLTALVFALTVGMLAVHGFGVPDPLARGLDEAGLALAAGASLPLVAVRRWPMTAYGLTVAAAVVMALLHYPYDVPFGPLLGAYVLAGGYDHDGRSRRLAAMAATGFFVPAIAVALLTRDAPTRGMLSGLAFWALLFVGAWVAGDRARLRRQVLAELESRAEYAAHEARRERRLAAAEERTRIARELHDSAGHAVNVILVQAGAARLLSGPDPDGSRRALATVETVARTLIGEIDRLVHALREGDPATPADPADIDELLARHRADGLRLTTDIRGHDGRLPHSLAWATYRILQEALTNASRHGTGDADVRVRYRPGAVEIDVTNAIRVNGAPRAGGHGIVGMTERASLLGGSLRTRTDEGVFRLHAVLPYPEQLS